MAQNARDIAVSALVNWEKDATYSNIMLDQLLRASSLSAADAAFVTRLVYGVIERRITLDWVLEKQMKQPLKKCHATVRAVLRAGAYQLLYMAKIPSSAAVNEAVSQTKRMKQAHASGFVNGVLRAVDREGERLLASLTTDLKGHSVRHSVPLSLLQSWKRAYGQETAVALAAAANEAPPTVIRVNTLKTSVDALTALLSDNEIAWSAVEGLSEALVIHDAAKLRAGVDDTLYYIQDAASQWACAALDAQEGDMVIDVCAAPGGKSLTSAMRMNNKGKIVSCDIYEEKTATLKKRAEKYGATIMEAHCRDASSECPQSWRNAFDRVICDVPCSGYGVIRRRPEIRYKPLDDFCSLADLQYRILCEAANMVKNGGVLQYSTCTLRPEENEQIVSRFLEEHQEFSPRELPVKPLFDALGIAPSHQITLMPHIHGTDGFFIASFKRKGAKDKC